MLTFFRLLSYLPLFFLHSTGALCGWIVYALSPVYRRRMKENLALAFPGQNTNSIRRQAVAQIGRMIFELPKLWFSPPAKVAALVTRVSDGDILEQALAAGHGIVFIAPHLGSFEISARYFSRLAPITVLYRPHKKKYLRAVVAQGRVQEGLNLAQTDLSGVRLLVKALRRGEAIGLLPDQVPRAGEGFWVNFFGRPAYTMALAGRLSESKAAVVFAFAERLPWGRGYHLHFYRSEPPLSGDVTARTEQINRMLEMIIRTCPQQYLWSYNRYKPPPGVQAPTDLVL